MTTRRIRLVLAGLLAAWIGLAVWIIPAAIRWVHGGGGPARLRRIMHAGVPLDAYLVRWSHLALRMSLVLVTLTIIAWFMAPLLGLRRGGEAPPPDTVAPPPPLTLPAVLWVSVWFGLVFGLGESHYLGWKTLVLHEVVPKFRYVSTGSLWMAPLVDTAALIIVGTLLWSLGRMVRRPLAIRWLVLAATFVALASLVLVTGRLTMIAAVVLSLGLGVRAGAMASEHRDRFQRYVRRSVPWLASAVLVVALLVTVIPGVVERRATSRLPTAPTNAPNVLVIILDTERASSMGLYGYRRPTTPNLARLAQRGVLFDRAMAPASWTLPSHASMFTSRYPGELSTSFLDPLDAKYPTLAEVLRDRGYMTAGFAANLVFCTPLFGLDRGFVHYDAQSISLQMTLESAWLGRGAYRLLTTGGERTAVRRDAAEITDGFLAWQATQPAARPWLAFLNYFDAHGPYASPPPYRTMFTTAAGAPPIAPGPKADETLKLINAYDGAIAYLDAQLALLYAELEKRGQLARTLVILTADHGEEFGEHGYFGHGIGVEMPILHVPLLVMHPSLHAGTRIAQAVTLTDLPATVMDFAGVRSHPFHGRSWSRLWNPTVPQDTVAEPVFSEYGSRKSILQGNWHFMVGHGEALYDVAADPAEQRNLVTTADPALVARLRASIEAFRRHERPAGGVSTP